MILGIDPGATGAVALVGETEIWPPHKPVYDLPVVEGIVDPYGFHKFMTSCGFHDPPYCTITHAYLERCQSMPGQGVVSIFRYGISYGMLRGVLAAMDIPVTLVPPQKWKKAFGLIGKDKEASRALAIQWYPNADLHLKKHHGRAEALLIARWGMTHGTT